MGERWRLVQIAMLGVLALGCSSSTPREVIDVDGNSYEVVKLGSQTWLAENLRAAHSPSGAPLATFAPDNDAANIAAFGRLYPWEAARQACPAGWRLASDEDWTLLERFLGDSAAARLREPGYWPPRTSEGADPVPFHARPAGYSNDQGFDNYFGSRAVYWTSSRQDSHFVWSRVLLGDQRQLRRAPQHPQYAFSVRCVRGG